MSALAADSTPIRLLDAVDPVEQFGTLSGDTTIALPTSGSTTGAPRSVVRTVRSWRAAFPAVTERTGLTARSRLWLPGPLSSTMNLYAAVHAASLGAGSAGSLDEATHVHLTPHVLRTLLDEAAPLKGRTLVVAGDGLDPDLRERAEGAGAIVTHYYGAAELSFVAWGADRAHLHPLPEVQVEVRGGELWVAGPYLAQGYLDGDGPMGTDDRGFATVGDRGRLDVDGRLTVTGRPGAITTGGATVLIADVEAALRPSTRGPFAVLGLPHAQLGEIVVAVVSDPGARARSGSLSLGAGRPRRWIVRSDLPLTEAGKLDRSRLRADLLKS